MESPSHPHQFSMYSANSALGQMISALKSSAEEEKTAGHQPRAPPATLSMNNSVASVPRPMKLVPPYFDYTDHSHVPDANPSVPLTAPGRLPNFPVKMLAILSREDMSHIISWMPHGRSWRVLKPREFEVKVIPAYFEHSKFSSFIRQANGWGFRRITKGPDRNSYYHELFLRGLPHLTKQMQRPHPSQKPALNPHTEPKFYEISQEHPLPECNKEKGFAKEADQILVQCSLVQRGNFSNGSLIITGDEDMNPKQTVSLQENPSPSSSVLMMPQRSGPVAQKHAPIQPLHNLDDWEPTPVEKSYFYSPSTFQQAIAQEPTVCMEPLPLIRQDENRQVYRRHAAPSAFQHENHHGQLSSDDDNAMVVPLANLPSCGSFPDLGEFLAKCASNLQEQSQCMEPLPLVNRARYQAAVIRRGAPSSNYANATWTRFAADEPVLTKTHIEEFDMKHHPELDEFDDTLRATDSFINALDLGQDVQRLFDF